VKAEDSVTTFRQTARTSFVSARYCPLGWKFSIGLRADVSCVSLLPAGEGLDLGIAWLRSSDFDLQKRGICR
jgi:hypothetical protein